MLNFLADVKKFMLQYREKTVDEFRQNNYKMNDRNFLKGQTCMQQHLFEHFPSEDHCSFLEDLTITFIDKTDPKDPNRREHYWRNTLKTMATLVLNVEDDQVDSAMLQNFMLYTYSSFQFLAICSRRKLYLALLKWF